MAAAAAPVPTFAATRAASAAALDELAGRPPLRMDRSHQHIELVVMDEIRSLFSSVDNDDDDTINLNEFLTCAASLGIPRWNGVAGTCDPAKAFALLDVDGSGQLSLDELCLAIGPNLLAAKQRGVTATACLADVITKLHAPAAGPAAVATATMSRDTKSPTAMPADDVLRRPEERELTCCDYTSSLFPCYWCCSTFGRLTWHDSEEDGDALVGLNSLIDYVVGVKEESVEYYWSVKCYHYLSDDKDSALGNFRVDTHWASVCGRLDSKDLSETFVPITSKQSIALKSKLDAELTPEFKLAYERARDQFLFANFRDSECDFHESLLSVPGLKEAQAIQLVEGEPPFWSNDTAGGGFMGCALACCGGSFCCGPCYLYKMQESMGLQVYTFRKSCGGFAAPAEPHGKLNRPSSSFFAMGDENRASFRDPHEVRDEHGDVIGNQFNVTIPALF